MKARKVIVRGQTQWAVSLGKKFGFDARTRIFGSTKEEAESRADDKLSERRLHGKGLADLTASHRALIVEWRDRLTADEMRAAFAAFIERRGCTKTVRDAVADYVKAKTTKDARGRSVWSADHASAAKPRLNRFAEKFGDKPLGELVPGEIKAFIAAQGGSAGTFHRTLRAMFDYSRGFRWIPANPFEEMGKAPDDEGAAKDLMTPAQFEQLLKVAAGFVDEQPRRERMLAAFVLGGLAGLRTAEVQRLTWGKIDLAAGRIELDRDTTRKRGLRGRFVELEPAAAEWLRALKRGASAERVVKLTDKNFRDQRQTIARAAKFQKWSHNILRRSFASHHLALHENGGRTAAAMGHTDAETTFAKYRVPATREAAEKWFALTPAKVAEVAKIVPFDSAAA